MSDLDELKRQVAALSVIVGGLNGTIELPNQALDTTSGATFDHLNLGTANSAASGQLIASGGTVTHVLEITDAGTNTSNVGLTAQHRTSGTPAASFGATLALRGDSANNTLRTLSTLTSTWVVATDGSRTSRLVLSAQDFSVGARECLRIESSGAAPLIGFLGAAAVGVQTSGGAAPAGGTGTTAGAWDTAAHRDAAITTINDIRTGLINLGLFS